MYTCSNAANQFLSGLKMELFYLYFRTASGGFFSIYLVTVFISHVEVISPRRIVLS